MSFTAAHVLALGLPLNLYIMITGAVVCFLIFVAIEMSSISRWDEGEG